MDPITGAILAAVTAGVTSGATEVGKKVMVNSYNALKTAIQKKYGKDSKIDQAVLGVEEEPDFQPNQEALAGRVKQENAHQDKELVKLAQALLENLQKTSKGQAAVSNYIIQMQDSQVGVMGDHAHVEGGHALWWFR